MKIAHSKFKNILIIIASSIIITVILVIGLISPITKYLVEKYSEKVLGRQIKMSWVYVNPFTGYIYISNLKIYESRSLRDIKKDDSITLSAKALSANIAMLKLLSKTIEISEITLNSPKGIIIQNKKDFNFSDLIKKFTPDKQNYDTTPSSIHFNILNMRIIDGTFYYLEEVTPVKYFIKEVNIESAGKYWNKDTMTIKLSFLSGPANGRVKACFAINFKTLNYSIAANVKKYDLKFAEQYLKDLVNFENFSGNIDADIKASGNFKDQENLNTMGLVSLNDFHFGKNRADDYVSFDRLFIKIDQLNQKSHKYLIDSISLSHPYIKYERYDYLDNLQMMFGKKGANISAARANHARFNLILEIADYVKVLVKNFLRSDYRINRVAIYKGIFKFNDFSTAEQFSTEANPFYIIADSIIKTHKRVSVSLKTGVQPYGKISAILSINPRKYDDFDLQYHLQGIPMSMFNPYLITYTSYPFDNGSIELSGKWKVRSGMIRSNNHLLINDPHIGSRMKNKNLKWLPLNMAMFLVLDQNNVIDYKIPVTGNLKNPKFHLKDVVFDILENIFIKPVATFFRINEENAKNETEKSITLKWKMRQNSLLPDQERFLKKMVKFLIRNPEASIAIYPVQYAKKEKEYIRFFEAKKKYFLLSKPGNAQFLTKRDSMKVENMSVKDAVFVRYLNKKLRNKMLFTIQEKCNNFVGSAIINAKFNRINKERKDAFMLCFMKKEVQNRIKIYIGENSIPYNGFSFYKIVYIGKFPKSRFIANE